MVNDIPSYNTILAKKGLFNLEQKTPFALPIITCYAIYKVFFQEMEASDKRPSQEIYKKRWKGNFPLTRFLF